MSKWVLTDRNGQFDLSVNFKSGDTLVFKYLGYEVKRVGYHDIRQSVMLNEFPLRLDEVTVVSKPLFDKLFSAFSKTRRLLKESHDVHAKLDVYGATFVEDKTDSVYQNSIPYCSVFTDSLNLNKINLGYFNLFQKDHGFIRPEHSDEFRFELSRVDSIGYEILQTSLGPGSNQEFRVYVNDSLGIVTHLQFKFRFEDQFVLNDMTKDHYVGLEWSGQLLIEQKEEGTYISDLMIERFGKRYLKANKFRSQKTLDYVLVRMAN